MSDDDHEHEYYSQCCGAQTSMMEHMICPDCRDNTAFECECGETYR